MCMSVQKERETETKIQIYFKELAPTVVEAFGKSKICRVDWEAGDPEKSCTSSLKAICWQNSFLPKESAFVLLRFSTDWMRPIHVMKDNLLYSESSDLNAYLIQKTLS